MDRGSREITWLTNSKKNDSVAFICRLKMNEFMNKYNPFHSRYGVCYWKTTRDKVTCNCNFDSYTEADKYSQQLSTSGYMTRLVSVGNYPKAIQRLELAIQFAPRVHIEDSLELGENKNL